MRSSFILVTLCTALTGCATDAVDTDQGEGPPFVEDEQSLGNGKADGGLRAGSSNVRGQQSGYRSDEANFFCTPGGKAAFEVNYVNKSLPWGVKLSLWRGMNVEEWCGGCEPAYDYTIDWADHQVTDMKPVGPWTWSVRSESFGYASGAGGRFINMRYVVRITMPDGSVRWDNGGSNVGYYQVQVPDPKCRAAWTPWQTFDSDPIDLPVSTVFRY